MTRDRDYDFRARETARRTVPTLQSVPDTTLTWPVEGARIAETVLERRANGEPHQGLDLYVPAGTVVRAALGGRVMRVRDGRMLQPTSTRRAGLWVDVLADDGRIHRYLHLGTAEVKTGEWVEAAQPLGTVAKAGTSGTGRQSHLHFEVRAFDETKRGGYGAARDPLRLLPKQSSEGQ